MTIDERARKIVEAFMLPGDVSAMITFVAAELRAVQMEAYNKGLLRAAEIAGGYKTVPGCEVNEAIAERIREEAGKV